MSLMGFMQSHRSFGEAATRPYGNTITVAASAIDGKGRVSVHGRTKSGHSIGGLMDVAEAERLVEHLREAIDYAVATAMTKVQSQQEKNR